MHGSACKHCQEKEAFYRHQAFHLYPNFLDLKPGHRRRRRSIVGSPGLRLLCYTFNSSSIQRTQHIESPDHLRQHIEAASGPSAPGPIRRLYVLEGVDDEYMTIFGAYLKIDPLFWMRHLRSSTWDTNLEGDGNVSPLASLTDADRTFNLWYCQLIRLDVDEQDVSMFCADEERHIACSRVDGKLDGVGSVHRKTSFWAVPCENGGWEALLVVDRPIQRIVARRRHIDKISTMSDSQAGDDERRPVRLNSIPTPFQGGIADFIDYANIDEAAVKSGPPRTSMFDDLRYYFENHCDRLCLSSRPRSVTTFVEKIVASEYMLLIQYHQNLLCKLQWRLSRHDHFGQYKIDWIEQTWSDLMSFQRRLDNRRISVQEIVRVLTPLPVLTTSTSSGSSSSSTTTNIASLCHTACTACAGTLTSAPITGLSTEVIADADTGTNTLEDHCPANDPIDTCQSTPQRDQKQEQKQQRQHQSGQRRNHLTPRHMNWLNTSTDFIIIQTQLQNLLLKTNTLVAAVTALSGATAAQQSLNEAHSVRNLSHLATFFLPLNLVAAIFSMSDSYRPGAPLFWVYFAVCVPFVLLINGLAALWVNSISRHGWKKTLSPSSLSFFSTSSSFPFPGKKKSRNRSPPFSASVQSTSTSAPTSPPRHQNQHDPKAEAEAEAEAVKEKENIQISHVENIRIHP